MSSYGDIPDDIINLDLSGNPPKKPDTIWLELDDVIEGTLPLEKAKAENMEITIICFDRERAGELERVINNLHEEYVFAGGMLFDPEVTIDTTDDPNIQPVDTS